MLITIPAVLSKDEVRQFRNYLDGGPWEEGARTAGSLAGKVKQNRQLEETSEMAVSLGNHILRALGAHPQFISAALPRKIYPPRFNRYEGGETYGMHIDNAIMQVANAAVSVRTDLAATLFLSEPADYDGGELTVETSLGPLAVKLAAGDMVLYPASSLHTVTPVNRGARFASFFWIESMVGDATDRSLLYELDQTIQQLTPALPDGDRNLLRLTGIYHNLLRRWAIT